MDRHPIIAERICQNLTKSRASVTQDKIRSWQEEVYSILERDGVAQLSSEVEARRVFNADETAFFLNPKGGKVLAARGDKSIYQCAGNDEKENITVLVTGNAAGELAPPMIVYRYTRVPSHIYESVPKEWGVGKSEKGWMNCELFYEYMANIFLPWVIKNEIERPIIFFLDGHVSHLSLELSQFCKQNGIVLVALLPNATHLLQPMDVAVFRTLKMNWQEKVQNHRMHNESLTKATFAPLLKELIAERLQKHPLILQNGFRKCGLVPWCPSAVHVLETESTAVNPMEVPGNRRSERLLWLESLIGSEKLNVFHSGIVPIEDTGLFEVWRNACQQASPEVSAVRNHDAERGNNPFAVILNNPREPARNSSTVEDSNDLQETTENGSPADDLSNLQEPTENRPTTVHLNDHQELAGGSPPADDMTVPILNKQPCVVLPAKVKHPPLQPTDPAGASLNTLVPSPFKRSLFYPKENQRRSKKPREKMPSVITSSEWELYKKKEVL